MRKVLVILTLIILLVACSEDKSSTAEERRKEIVDSIKQDKADKEKNKPKNRIGKYVYIDHFAVTHVNLHCSYINYVGNESGTSTDEEGNQIDVDRNIRHGSGVERVLLKDYDKELLANACKSCVDDDMYEYLQKYGTLEGLFGEEEDESKEMVYATLSGTKYHKTADCSALKRSKSNVDEISVVQAESEGKEPCRRCYKH